VEVIPWLLKWSTLVMVKLIAKYMMVLVYVWTLLNPHPSLLFLDQDDHEASFGSVAAVAAVELSMILSGSPIDSTLHISRQSVSPSISDVFVIKRKRFRKLQKAIPSTYKV
jgi:hypothetical protein